MSAPRSRLEWSVNIVDWRRDTSHLTPAERGAYMALLMFYWEHGGLPGDDDDALRRIAGCEGGVIWHDQRRRIKKLFRDGWRHKRMDADLERAASFSARQRAAARVRWDGVNSGEKQIDGRGLRKGGFHQSNQRPIDAGALPLECSNRIDRSIPISSNSAAVDKSRPKKQTDVSPNQLKPKPPAYRRAQQTVLRALSAQLGERAYAEAIDLLAGHPDVIERATAAETRVPGSGVMSALIGMKPLCRD